MSNAYPTPMIAAYVARIGRDGVGVEWCEYGPDPVLELLHPVGVRRDERRHVAGNIGYLSASETPDEPKSIAEA